MTIIADIPYSAVGGSRTTGDLYLPACPEMAPAALLIHGGGWRSHAKERMAGIADMLVGLGYGVFAVNYRLVTTDPWPACGDDCLAAARFLADACRSAMRPLNRRRLLIVGASAGGHLALTTGLRLPGGQVAGIVSLAGPSDLRGQISGVNVDAFPESFWQLFFGAREISPAMRFNASPVSMVPPHPPPLLCVHSVNDDLVRIEQSEAIVAACREQGGQARLFAFDGAGKAHGIWRADAEKPPRLLPSIEAAVADFARETMRGG